MADQIREYVIKIKADVKEALDQVNELSGKFDKIEIKNTLPKGFKAELEKITGKIGELASELSGLKSEFKGISFRDFTSDIKSSFSEINDSMKQLQKVGEGFNKIFDNINSDGGSSIKQFVQEMKQQMTDLLKSYQDAANEIRRIQDSGFVLPQIETPEVKKPRGGNKRNKTQLTDYETSAAEQEKQALDIIKKIKDTQKKLKNHKTLIDLVGDTEAYPGSDYDISDMQFVVEDLKKLEGILNTLKDQSDAVNNALKEIKLPRNKVNRVRNILKKQIDTGINNNAAGWQDTLDEIKGPTKQRIKQNIAFEFDVVESDNKQVLQDTVAHIVDKIQKSIQSEVQKEISKKPIRIPVSIGSSELIEQEQDEGKILSDKVQDEGMIKNLQVAIKAHADGLLSDVNSKIEEINKQITSTINVKIKPIAPDRATLETAIGEIEGATAEQIDQGIQIDAKNMFKVQPQSDDRVIGVLDGIKGIVSEISGKMGSIRIEMPQGVSGMSGQQRPPSSPPPVSPPPASSPVYTPPIQTAGDQVINAQNVQMGDAQNVKVQSHNESQSDYSPYTDSRIMSETGAFGDEGLPKNRRRRDVHMLSKTLPFLLTRGTHVIQEAEGYANANQRMSVDASIKQEFYKGMGEFVKDIQSRAVTQADVQSRPYYKARVVSPLNDQEYAYYGQPGEGETLQEWQQRLNVVYETADDAITKYTDLIHEEFEAKKNSTQMVDSGIKGRKVPEWMKIIIDDSMRKEANQTTDGQLKGRIQREIKAGNEDFIKNNRSKIISGYQSEFDTLESRRQTLLPKLRPYQDVQFKQSQTKSIIDALTEKKSVEGFASWYNNKDSSQKHLLEAVMPAQIRDYILGSGADYKEIREEMISYFSNIESELGQQLKKLSPEYNLAKEEIAGIENKQQVTKQRKFLMETGTDLDVAREVVHREFKAKRDFLSSGQAVLTEEREGQLQDIESHIISQLIGKIARGSIRGQDIGKELTQLIIDRIFGSDVQSATKDKDKMEKWQQKRAKLESMEEAANFEAREQADRKAVKNQQKSGAEAYRPFGVDALKEPNMKNISRAEIKDERTRRLIDKLEQQGLFVDPETSKLTSNMTGKAALDKKGVTNDVYERLAMVGEIGDRALNEQRLITDQLSANENAFKQYVRDFEEGLNTGGIDQRTVSQMADTLYNSISEDTKDFLIETKQALQEKIAKNRADSKIDTTNVSDRDMLKTDRERDMWDLVNSDFVSQMEHQFEGSTPQQIYDAAKSMLTAISESREKETQIVHNTENAMKDIIDSALKGKVTTDTYIKNETRMGELRKQITDLESRMERTAQSKVFDPDTGKMKTVYGYDPKTLTPFERGQYWKARNEFTELRNQQIGYEMENGIRDWRGRVKTPQGSVASLYNASSRVVNLGLSPELQNIYAHIPNPDEISRPKLDEHGFPQEQGGEILREAVGYAADQLHEFSSALRETNSEIDKEIESLPKTPEEINTAVQQRVQEDISSILNDRNEMRSKLRGKLQQFKKDHAEEFASGDDETRSALLARFRSANKKSLQDIRSAKNSADILTYDKPTRERQRLERNNTEIQNLQAQIPELAQAIMSLPGGNLPKNEKAVKNVQSKLAELTQTRDREKAAREELASYVSDLQDHYTEYFDNDSELQELLMLNRSYKKQGNKAGQERTKNKITQRQTELMEKADRERTGKADSGLVSRQLELKTTSAHRQSLEAELRKMLPLSLADVATEAKRTPATKIELENVASMRRSMEDILSTQGQSGLKDALGQLKKSEMLDLARALEFKNENGNLPKSATKDDLSKLIVGEYMKYRQTTNADLGDTHAKTLTGDIINRLLEALNRIDALAEENRQIEQNMEANGRTGDSRTDRENVYRQDIENRRNGLIGIQRINEQSAEKFDRMAYNMENETEADKRVRLAEESKKRDRENKEKKISEMNQRWQETLQRLESTSIEDIVQEAQQAFDQQKAAGKEEVAKLMAQQEAQRERITTNLSMETAEVKRLGAKRDAQQKKVDALAEQIKPPSDDEIRQNQQEAYDNDTKLLSLQKQLEDAKKRNDSKTAQQKRNAISSRKVAILAEKSQSLDLNQDIENLQDAVARGDDEATIQRLSDSVLQRHRTYQKYQGQFSAVKDQYIDGMDPIAFASQRGTIEEAIVAKEQQILDKLNEELAEHQSLADMYSEANELTKIDESTGTDLEDRLRGDVNKAVTKEQKDRANKALNDFLEKIWQNPEARPIYELKKDVQAQKDENMASSKTLKPLRENLSAVQNIQNAKTDEERNSAIQAYKRLLYTREGLEDWSGSSTEAKTEKTEEEIQQARQRLADAAKQRAEQEEQAAKEERERRAADRARYEKSKINVTLEDEPIERGKKGKKKQGQEQTQSTTPPPEPEVNATTVAQEELGASMHETATATNMAAEAEQSLQQERQESASVAKEQVASQKREASASIGKTTYKGREYDTLSKEQRDAIVERMKDSADLKPLMKVSSKSGRRDRKAIQRTKDALNAYALTGDETILQELKASFRGGRGGGNNFMLSKKIRPGVQKFIDQELGTTQNTAAAETQMGQAGQQAGQQVTAATQEATQAQKELKTAVEQSTQAMRQQDQASAEYDDSMITFETDAATGKQSRKKSSSKKGTQGKESSQKEQKGDIPQVTTTPTPQTTGKQGTMSELAGSVKDVTSAVEAKNSAFVAEQGIVTKSVQAEITALGQLKNAVDGVTKSTQEKNTAMSGEGTSTKDAYSGGKKSKTSDKKSSKASADAEDGQANANTDEAQIAKAINQYKQLIKTVDTYAQTKQKIDEGQSITGGQQSRVDDWEASLAEAEAVAEKFKDTNEELANSQMKLNSALSTSKEYYKQNSTAQKEAATQAKKEQTERERLIASTNNQLSKITERDRQRFAEPFKGLGAEIERLNDEFKNGESDVEKYKNGVASAFKEFNRFKTANPSGETLDIPNLATDADGVLNQLRKYVADQYKIVTENVSGGAVNSEGIGRFSAQVVDANNNVQNLKFTWDSFANTVSVTASTAADQFKGRFLGLISELQAKSKQLFLYWTAQFLNPYQLIGVFKQAINIVKEYDTALTEMRKVSDESLSTLKQFQQESFGMADALGTTGKQIQNSTADWLRLGESFEEAKKSAEVSNLLLNVSEFQSIDDATQSLVSASQAFKDLDKIEIVDKLNNIGNNFSVSTDQLAQGLQNAAAVLKTQGNDLDQSLALLTAGNAITQDISKTSAGIRTISLRISGTEEAKDEIADLGEDVDDFVVRTKSKTDQIIRDYTAVASNSYQGVSVLDDNGNLRDTYSILLDIAQVYKEIQSEDKQRGTNRAQALVETLAGKNRSNIAASILNNPELLQDVYEASQNSAGSAMVENEKYLDSMTGKMQQMQNHVEEIANIIANSDGLKVVLDLVNQILSAVTDLVKTFGGLPSILGTIGGVMLQRKGLGALDSTFGLGKDIKSGGGWAALIKGMFSKKPDTSAVTKQVVNPLYKTITEGLSQYNLNPETSFLNGLKRQGVNFTQAKNELGLADLFGNMKRDEAAKFSTAEVLEMLRQKYGGIQEAAEGASESIGGFAGKLGGIGGIIKNVGAGLASMAISTIAVTAISAAIGGLITLFYNLATAQQRAIEAGKQAQQSIEQAKKSYDDTTTSITEVQEEFAKLSTGVSETGTNISLSEEEYSRFLEISGQLAEIAPELVTGYDNQGNAIVALGDTVEEVNSKFQEYLNTQRDIANADIGSNLDTVFTGIKNQVTEYNGKLEQAKADYDRISEETIEGSDIIGAYNSNFKRQDTSSAETRFVQIHKDKEDEFVSYLTKMGLTPENLGEVEGTPDVLKYSVRFDLLNEDELNDVTEKVNTFILTSESTAAKDSNLSKANIKKYEMLINAEYKKIIPAIQNYITTSPFFDDISGEEMQQKFRQGMVNIFSGLTYDEEMAKQMKAKGGVENFVDDFIYTMMANDDTQKAFEKLINLEEDRAHMTVDEYREARKTYYDIIQKAYTDPSTGESAYSTEYLDSFFGDDYKKREQDAARKLGLASEKDQQDFIATLHNAKIENEENLLNAIESMSQDDTRRFHGIWKEILAYINPFLSGEIKPEKAKPDGTLAEMFANEEYVQSVEKYQTNLSSLASAAESIRTEGRLTEEQMVSLREAFTDFGSTITSDDLSVKALENLSGWLKQIREQMKGMSDEEKQQAQLYSRDLIRSNIANFGFSENDVRDLFMQRVSDVTPFAGLKEGFGANYDKKISELQAMLPEGETLSFDVVASLILQDQFSGTATEIYNKYNDEKLTWTLTLENQELEKDIEKQQAKIENAQAMRNTKSARGEVITSGDYDIELSAVRQVAEDRRREAKNAYDVYQSRTGNERAKAEQDWLIAETAARQAEADELQLEKESIEAETNELQSIVQQQDNAVTEAENAIAEAEAKYGEGMADQKLYENLAKAQMARAAANVDLSDEWERLAKEHPEWATEFMANALSASSSAQSDTQSAKANDTREQQQKLNVLQEQATKLQRELTVAEQKHQKVSKSTYQDLIKNAKEQIKNLRAEQYEVRDDISAWRTYQDQIDSLNDSIYDWGQSIDSLVFDQASELASTLQTAISESFSETGLTTDTINAIIKGFSDLTGKDLDVSDAFYNTADGVKVNTAALQELTEAEFDLQSTNITNEIEALQAALDQDPGNSALQQKLESLMQTQAQYFAQYEEMQAALSRYNAIDLAEQTANYGSHYDKSYERLKTYKEASDNGDVGTDEFKAYTAYLDKFGRTTDDAFQEVYEKASRYLTEDASEGLTNFMTDLQSFGYAEKDAEGAWTYRIEDMNEAAQKLGIGTEFFQDMFGKLQDKGGIFNVVSSLTEATLKTQDLEEQIKEATQAYAEMFKSGASEDELTAQKDFIAGLYEQLSGIDTARDDYINNQEEQRKEDFKNIEKNLEMYQTLYDEAKASGDDKLARAIREMARKEISQFGYDLAEGKIALAEESAADYDSHRIKGSLEKSLTAKQMGLEGEDAETYDKTIKSLKKLLETEREYQEVRKQREELPPDMVGNVDLNHRPIVLDGEDYHTLFSESYFMSDFGLPEGENGEVAFNVTPILPDGTMLDKYGLEQYISEQLASGKKLEDLDIYMGSFGSIDEASEAAEAAHNANEEMYSREAELLREMSQNGDLATLTESLSGYTADYLKDIDHANGEWADGEKELEQLCDTLGVGYDNANLLVDALAGLGLIESPGVVDEIPETLAAGKEQLQEFISNNTRAGGEPFKIDVEPDFSKMDETDIQSELDQIDILRKYEGVKDNSEIMAYLDELERKANIQLDINSKLSGDVDIQQLKQWAADDKTDRISQELEIDVDSEEFDMVMQKLTEMPDEYDMAIHIDDAQFDQLISTIEATHPEIQADVEASPESVEAMKQSLREKLQGGLQQASEKIQVGIQQAKSLVGSLFTSPSEPQKLTQPQTSQPSMPTQTHQDLDTDFSTNPVVKPVIDLSDVEKGKSETVSMFENAHPVVTPVVENVDTKQPKAQTITQKVVTDTGDSQNELQKTENEAKKAGSTVTIPLRVVGNEQAEEELGSVENKVTSLDQAVANPQVNMDIPKLNTYESALDRIRMKMDNLPVSKTTTLTTVEITKKKTVSEALGTAHAAGTTRVAGAKLSHAYVSGSQDWTVGQDEDALVNEIGQESRVHDGVWELLPGGPHVEHLDKDDIIYKCDFIR